MTDLKRCFSNIELLTVALDGNNIKDIKEENRTTYMEQIAVLRSPEAIKYIKNPSVEMRILAEIGRDELSYD